MSAQVRSATRMRARAVQRYQRGDTTREIAAVLGVHESTVRRWLRSAGVVMRLRGPRPTIDTSAVRTGRHARNGSWSQVAAAVGASPTGVRAAYRRVTGSTGARDLRTHLTGAQRKALRDLADRVPIGAGGGRAVRTSSEGAALADALRWYAEAGVPFAELAEATRYQCRSAIGYIIRP